MTARSVLWFFVYISFINNAAKANEEKKGLTEVDVLLKSIELEKWSDDELPCWEATLSILHGVKNSTLWATWIWDSIQRPTGFLYGSRYQMGSFDQCMKPPWLESHPHLRTQYCLADIHLTDVKPKKQRTPLDPYSTSNLYIERTSKHGILFNVLSWGVCLPSSCSQFSVLKILRAMLRMQHLPVSKPNAHIKINSCQQATDILEYPIELKVFLVLLLSLTLMSLLAMFLSLYTTVNYSIGSRLINSFNLKSTWNNFIKESKDEISSVNGIKFLNSTLTIMLHYIIFVHYYGVLNNLNVEKDFDTYYVMSMTHLDVTVDTFFFISGLLLMTGLYGKRNNPIIGLIKRYIRMAVPLAVTIFYFSAVHKYVGSGPLWPTKSLQEEELCKKNWWVNFLMLTNFVKCDEMCHFLTWYLAADFQLVVFGSSLFYIYQKSNRVGKWLFGICFVVTALLPAFLTYQYEMPAVIFSDIQKMIDRSTNEVFLKIYVKSYCWASVYLLGMFLGYYMSYYKPADYRNTISQKWSIIGITVAFYVMHKILAMGGSFLHKEYDLVEVTTFVLFDRNLWALAIGGLIIICEYGYAPIVTDILHFKLFGAGSKLSYSMYLTHAALLYRLIHYTRTPRTHDMLDMFVTGIGVTFSILPFALFMYLFIEAPAGNLVNSLFRSKNSTSVKQRELSNNSFTTNMNGAKTEDKSKLA